MLIFRIRELKKNRTKTFLTAPVRMVRPGERLHSLLLKAGRLLACVAVFISYSHAQHNISARTQRKPSPVVSKTERPQFLNPKSLHGNGLCFTPNKGQIVDMDGKLCPDVLYKGSGAGTDIYLRKTGISYVYSNMGEVLNSVNEQVEELINAGIITEADEKKKKEELLQRQTMNLHRVDMDFSNSNQNITTATENEIDGYQNYYYAHCTGGITNVKEYNKVICKNIYNNIDIAYYGDKQNGIKYDLIVQPHADPNQIKLHWKGAESIRINRDGNLVIKTSVNEFTESIPKVYQNINGEIVDVKAKYILTSISKGEAIISFSLSIFNAQYPLIIDPWVTYYGGTADDYGYSVATDAFGNVYLAGYTGSLANIASIGYQNVWAGSYDAFVAKFNDAGTRLWATYYGGTGWEQGFSVAPDAMGNVYLSGYTNSLSVIASGGFQNIYGGGYDAFLVKFDGTGVRLWATYYGGPGDDRGVSVAPDAMGNVYLSGYTNSLSGIASGGFQNIYGGGSFWAGDAFLVKFNGAGGAGSRLWATYYGGTGDDWNYNSGNSIAVDPFGNVYLAGITNSLVGIATGGFQNVYGGGTNDAFLVKFNMAGVRLWATYYGGTGTDWGYSVATDTLGNVYLAGGSNSSAGIAFGGFQNIIGGIFDGYLVKFNGIGARLWATYMGGSNDDYALSVAVDTFTNDVYVSGDTYSGNFTVSSCAWQTTFGGYEDGFLMGLTSGGNIICSSYLGGIRHDEQFHLALYGCYVYITGYVDTPFPITLGAHQTVFGGVMDAFVAQLYKNSCGNNTANLTAYANSNFVCTNTPINFTGNFSNCYTSAVYAWSFPGGSPSASSAQNPTGIIYPTVGSYTAQLIATSACDTDTVYVNVTINSCGGITANVNSATICNSVTPCPVLTATGANGTAPYTYLWSTTATTSSISPCPVSTTNYTVTISDAGGLTATSTAVVTVNPSVTVTATPTNIACNGGTNGGATANTNNGTSPYTYTWSNGGTTSQISNLTSQIYTVTVTDTKGCTAVSTAAIISPQPLIGQFAKGITNCAGCGCKQWIMVTATGGTIPYTYTWPDGYINRYKNQLCPGTYTINIKDKNGCSINVNISAP